MKTVIIEDELLQADHLKSLLMAMEGPPEVSAIVQSVGEAIDYLNRNSVDLIFLDIHLADGLCFEIFEKTDIRVPVIFTTAYDQYAIQAFRHNGIDYLLKPVTENDLRKSLEKYTRFTGYHSGYREMMDTFRSMASGFKPQRNRFISHLGKKLKIVEAVDIAYFYALGGGVFIRTLKNENLLVDQNLETLEKQLDTYDFFRLNRQIIARITAIKEMIPYSKSRIKIILTPPFEEDVIVSYRNVKDFMQWARK